MRDGMSDVERRDVESGGHALRHASDVPTRAPAGPPHDQPSALCASFPQLSVPHTSPWPWPTRPPALNLRDWLPRAMWSATAALPPQAAAQAALCRTGQPRSAARPALPVPGGGQASRRLAGTRLAALGLPTSAHNSSAREEGVTLPLSYAEVRVVGLMARARALGGPPMSGAQPMLGRRSTSRAADAVQAPQVHCRRPPPLPTRRSTAAAAASLARSFLRAAHGPPGRGHAAAAGCGVGLR